MILLSEGFLNAVDVNNWLIRSSIKKRVVLDTVENVVVGVEYKWQYQQDEVLVAVEVGVTELVENTCSPILVAGDSVRVGVDKMLFTADDVVCIIDEDLIWLSDVDLKNWLMRSSIFRNEFLDDDEISETLGVEYK